MAHSNSLSTRNGPGQVSGSSSRRYTPLGVNGSGRPSPASSSKYTGACAARPASISPGSSSLSDPVVGPGQAPRRRRNRAVLSCLKCHQRRVKCDRKQPCTACIRYGAPEDCKVPDNPKAHEERARIAASGGDSSDCTEDPDCCANSDDSTGHHNMASAPFPEPSPLPVSYFCASTSYAIPAPYPAEQSAAPDPYHSSIRTSSEAQYPHSYFAPSPLHISSHFPIHMHSLKHEGNLMSATSASNSPLEDYSSQSRFSSTLYGLVPPPTAPSGSGGSSWNNPSHRSRSDLDLEQRPYTANHTGGALSRFISEYEHQLGQTHPAPQRQYSPAHIEEIHTFCQALPDRNVEALVRSYVYEVEWMHQVVDQDSIMHRVLPDVVHRLLVPDSLGPVHLHERASQTRFGDMTRLCLLATMILCAIQATSESVLKLALQHAIPGLASVNEPASRLPSRAQSEGSAHDPFSLGATQPDQYGSRALTSSSAQSFGSGGVADTNRLSASLDSCDAPAAHNNPQAPVKGDVLTVLESQTRHLLQRAAAVEGASTDLIKARLIFIHFIKNEARMAQSGSFELLRDTADMAMGLHLHKDPEYLMVSDEEKEDRRRLFYNLYSLDRSMALYFGKKPCIPEDQVETFLPQERLVTGAKEQLYTFMLLKAKLAKVITRIAATSNELPIDGDAISDLDLQLQELVQTTQGTPFHTSLAQIPPELNNFHTLDRQRHLYLICFHSAREALHRLAFFEGAGLSSEQVAYSREACAQSAIALLETQRSLRPRICSTGDLRCFYLSFFTLEPAITLIISAIVVLQPNLLDPERSAKKVKVECYLEWARHALDLLRAMPEDVAVAAQGSYLLSRVLHKATAIADHHLNPLASISEDVRGTGFGVVGAHERALAAAISLEHTSAWMQELFRDEHGRHMEMPYMNPPARRAPFAHTAPSPAPLSASASEPFLDYHQDQQYSQYPYQDGSSPASASVYMGSGAAAATAAAASVTGGNAMDSIRSATQSLNLDPSHVSPSEQPPLPSALLSMQFATGFPAPTALIDSVPPSSEPATASPDTSLTYNLASSGLHLQLGQPLHRGVPALAHPAPTARLDGGVVEAGPSLSDLGLGFLDTFLDSTRPQSESVNGNNINGDNTDSPMGASSAQPSLASSTNSNTATFGASVPAAPPHGGLVGPGQAGLEAYMNEHLSAARGAPSQPN